MPMFTLLVGPNVVVISVNMQHMRKLQLYAFFWLACSVSTPAASLLCSNLQYEEIAQIDTFNSQYLLHCISFLMIDVHLSKSEIRIVIVDK